MDSLGNEVKNKALALGGCLCGIAPVERFTGLSAENDPAKILPGAKSVIVFAKRFLRSTAALENTVPYTVVRNQISAKMDDYSVALCEFIEDAGFLAVPVGAIGPDTYNSKIGKTTGLISLKNAAALAGLGYIGLNTLLITPKFGNMVWLGGLITTAELAPDDVFPAAKNPCKNCRKCVDSCLAHALNSRLNGSPFIDQNACRDYAFGEPAGGGEWRIKCHQCRTECPYSEGFQLK